MSIIDICLFGLDSILEYVFTTRLNKTYYRPNDCSSLDASQTASSLST